MTITFQGDQVALLLMLLNERLNKIEKHLGRCLLTGEEPHPISVRNRRLAESAKQKIEAAVSEAKRKVMKGEV